MVNDLSALGAAGKVVDRSGPAIGSGAAGTAS